MAIQTGRRPRGISLHCRTFPKVLRISAIQAIVFEPPIEDAKIHLRKFQLWHREIPSIQMASLQQGTRALFDGLNVQQRAGTDPDLPRPLRFGPQAYSRFRWTQEQYHFGSRTYDRHGLPPAMPSDESSQKPLQGHSQYCG